MKSKGGVFVIAGPSGVGKGTLIERALGKVDYPEKFHYSVSSTTRPPGKGEVEGKEYRFVSDEQFADMLGRDEFLEWEEVYGNRYGTLKSEVEGPTSSGLNVILELDVKGALTVRSKLEDARLVFIVPPSLTELESRLRRRDREDRGDIELRVGEALKEIEAGETLFDVVIVNDDLERAAGELAGVLRGEDI